MGVSLRAVAALSLLWFSSFAGYLNLKFTVPVTSDSGYCGAANVIQNDLSHIKTILRRCDGDTLLLPNIPIIAAPGDSMGFSIWIADSTVGVAEFYTVDRNGNESCDYASWSFAFPKLAVVGPPPPPPPDTTTTGIKGDYYNGRFRSTWIGTRRDSTIDFQWGLGSPMAGVKPDSFSVQWNGQLIIPTAGAWTLYVEVDDGAQLYEGVPGATNMRIDRLISQPLSEWSWTGNLVAGSHGIAVIYMGDTGNSQITLRISGPGFPKQVVPRAWLR